MVPLFLLSSRELALECIIVLLLVALLLLLLAFPVFAIRILAFVVLAVAGICIWGWWYVCTKSSLGR